MFHRNMKSGIILAFMLFLTIFKNWLTVFWSFTVTCQLSLIQLEYFLFVYKLRLFCTLFSFYSSPGCLVISDQSLFKHALVYERKKISVIVLAGNKNIHFEFSLPLWQITISFIYIPLIFPLSSSLPLLFLFSFSLYYLFFYSDNCNMAKSYKH